MSQKLGRSYAELVSCTTRSQGGELMPHCYLFLEGVAEAELEKNLERTFKIFFRGTADMVIFQATFFSV